MEHRTGLKPTRSRPEFDSPMIIVREGSYRSLGSTPDQSRRFRGIHRLRQSLHRTQSGLGSTDHYDASSLPVRMHPSLPSSRKVTSSGRKWFSPHANPPATPHPNTLGDKPEQSMMMSARATQGPRCRASTIKRNSSSARACSPSADKPGCAMPVRSLLMESTGE